ncbi:MAG: lysophospholipid acyltransferase family protein [Oscillospiraceae bacterium]
MRTIVWFIYFWIYLICLVPRMIKAQKLKDKGDARYEEIVNSAVPRWAKRLMRLAGADVTVSGIENIPKDKAVIYVCNHNGYFDIPLLLAYLDKPHALVAKKEIGKLPLIRNWMRLFDCIFIDRENPRQSVAGLNTAAQLVAQGKSVGIFPEGTRAKGREMGEFKGGGFKIASKTKAQIVPVAISGTHLLMEANNYWIHPAKVTMTILPPVETKDLTKEQIKELPSVIRQQILNAKDNK